MAELLNGNKMENNSDNSIQKEEISNHIETSVRQIKRLMYSYLGNPETASKADKLAYWLENYNKFLSFEDSFDPTYLKRYKRGDILKINLGYNVGNEDSNTFNFI